MLLLVILGAIVLIVLRIEGVGSLKKQTPTPSFAVSLRMLHIPAAAGCMRASSGPDKKLCADSQHQWSSSVGATTAVAIMLRVPIKEADFVSSVYEIMIAIQSGVLLIQQSVGNRQVPYHCVLKPAKLSSDSTRCLSSNCCTLTLRTPLKQNCCDR